jgi:asparagine synthase (glutamine-hydrolysing)
MCGITGVITPQWSQAIGAALHRALAGIRHRGPDDEGIAFEPDPPGDGGPVIALANRRLAIIDPGPPGHQPMSSADGRWTVVVNGEIYNYLELRVELERVGVRFRGHSDTEVLVEALAAWGTSCLGKLQGMFAMAALDRSRNSVILARDPFGIKPLYYGRCGTGLAFASEIPSLLEFPGVGRSIDPHRLHQFLTHSSTDHGDSTLLRDVRQVPSAHYLEVPADRPSEFRAHRYWSLDLGRDTSLSFGEAAECVRATFLESMRLHLRSDAPLGFALSGGIDSSAVVMAARHVLGAGHELQTFSFIPDDARIDEEHHVDAVGKAAGAVMHKFRLRPEELCRDIEALTERQGEPFSSPVIYAQYRVMQLAAESGVKVMLGGQGSDEMLSGYDRHLSARAASLLRQGRWARAYGVAARPVTPYPGGRRALLRGALLQALPGWASDTVYARLRPAHRSPPWIDERWFAERGVRSRSAWSATGLHVMREMLGHNLLESQIPALMRYEDRNAMAFSMENRVPFLTAPLVELLFSLPEEYLLADDGTRKAVFREAMRGIVPDSILDRRDKIGFSVPSMAWFQALRPWVSDHLSLASRLPCLVGQQVEMRRLALRSGKPWGDPSLVWRWVSLSTWAERFGVIID